MTSLAEYANHVVTDVQISELRTHTIDIPHVDIRRLGRRAVIVHYVTGESVQFVTTTDPKHVRRLAEGWAEYFESIKRKAVGT